MLNSDRNDVVIRDRNRPVVIGDESSKKELRPLTDRVDRRTLFISDSAEDSVLVGLFYTGLVDHAPRLSVSLRGKKTTLRLRGRFANP